MRAGRPVPGLEGARGRPSARARVVLGLAALALTALPLRRRVVGRREARAFRAVNGLPECLFAPVWVVMQLGALGSAVAAAGVAYLKGMPRLAVRLLEAGSITWALSKGVKRLARRGRPGALLADVRLRGKPASGLGYLSGHAGVAVALAGSALPDVGRRARLVMLSLVPLVGLSRVYVGAHLPLDVAGGAALGLVVEAALALRDPPVPE